jgi:hypothetical protein
VIPSERDWKDVEQAARKRKGRGRKTHDLQAYIASKPPANEYPS